MLENTGEDTFKSVSNVETGYYATEDSNKTVQNAEHYDGFQRTDSNMYKIPVEPPYQRNTEEKIPAENRGHNRKKLYIIGGLVLLGVIILVSVLGGVLGSRKSTSHSGGGKSATDTQSANDSIPSNSTTQHGVLPGTQFATVNNGSSSSTDFFYQTSTGRIKKLHCTLSADGKADNNCETPIDLNITDAKDSTPLSSVGIPKVSAHLFYLDTSNNLRSVNISGNIVKNDDELDQTVQSLGVQVHNQSQLAAIRFPAEHPTQGPESIRLYYQDVKSDIQELTYSESEGSRWSGGGNLGVAANGTKLAALGWEGWNDPTHLLAVRVYFEDPSNTLQENVLGDNDGFAWSQGNAPQRPMNPSAGLAAIVWEDQPSFLGQVLLYTTDTNNAVYEFGIRGPGGWTDIHEEDPNNMNASMDETSFSIMALNWLDKNTTTEALVTTQVFFRANARASGFEQVVCHDNGTWVKGPGLTLE